MSTTIGHFLLDDHLVLRVDGDLDIVADGDLGMGIYLEDNGRPPRFRKPSN
jgi:hypothetical protein